MLAAQSFEMIDQALLGLKAPIAKCNEFLAAFDKLLMASLWGNVV